MNFVKVTKLTYNIDFSGKKANITSETPAWVNLDLVFSITASKYCEGVSELNPVGGDQALSVKTEEIKSLLGEVAEINKSEK